MRPPHSPAPLFLLASLLLLATRAVGVQPGWLEVEQPGPEGVRVGQAILEVRGYAGARAGRNHDLVIALDLSDSTTRTSGLDLDGDGLGGRTGADVLDRLAAREEVSPLLVKRLREIDLEDSVLAAELLAAELLIERLDPRRFRVGVVGFSDRARVVAPLGSDRVTLRRGLHGLREGFHAYLRGTNFAAAIRLAHLQLLPDGVPTAGDRERSILLLSDGAPTLPVSRGGPELATYNAAAAAASDGVRIYAFALGSEADEALGVYGEIAALTGGRLERLDQPGDAIARLRAMDLADLASIRIRNATSGAAARAARTFPDGSFDAFVQLVEGPNLILFEAVGSDGTEARLERSVVYDQSLGADSAALEDLLEELRRRTRETQLWAEVERGRTEQLQEITLTPAAP